MSPTVFHVLTTSSGNSMENSLLIDIKSSTPSNESKKTAQIQNQNCFLIVNN